MSDYSEIFGREAEPWRQPLGALRLTLTGDPAKVDVERAQAEVEELVRVLNQHPPVEQDAEEPEWEYTTAERDGGPNWSRYRAWGSVDPHHAKFRRRKAGPWESMPAAENNEREAG